MPILPTEIKALLSVLVPVFSERVSEWVNVLVVGAILAPHTRTVSARKPVPQLVMVSHMAGPRSRQFFGQNL